MEASQSWFEKNGFTLDAVLHHQDIIPFIKEYLFTSNFFTLSYLFLNLLFLVALLFSFYIQISSDTVKLFDSFTWFGFGCALTFALVPIHEGLHGLAYKLCGAPSVSFAANWKKLYFMAIADKFVATRYPFYFIGSLPFLFISLVLIVLTLLSNDGRQIMLLSTLLIHTSMCAGDFGLMSYFAEKSNQQVATYDDHQNSVTYFFVK